MDLTIVIPLLNEAESLPELYERLRKVMEENLYTYEIIFVDDGSTDNSWQVIEELAAKDKHVRGIKFRRNYGKSQALNAAFREAQGDVVITMDADLQDFPEEIPELKNLIDNGADLVSGWKRKRYDNVLTKNIPSKVFNQVARSTSGVQLHDFNCGLKAYRNDVVKNIDVYGEMHRYIPVLAKNAGYNNIIEKEVPHQARQHGSSKFGSSRFIRGFLDLISLNFLNRFGTSPMHFFGTWGTVMFIFGFISAAYLGIDKLWKVFHKLPAKLVTDNAFFYIALTLMILGTQLFIAGFLGELFLRNQTEKYNYDISKTIN